MSNESGKRDTFADIAAQNVVYRESSMIEPEPQVLPDKSLPVGGPDAANNFVPISHISDANALDSELSKFRDRFAPFMRNLAPSLTRTRSSIPLETFDWRIQTEADQSNFPAVLDGEGEWEQVSIPHYGPPLGKAITYYRTRITFTEEQLAAGAAFVCFKGVDYKTRAYLNGTHLGSNEGFFAPFEFECIKSAKAGENILVVEVENDFICGGNNPWGTPLSGDKIYAATGLGYDDSEIGWHHCPPGMGIYQDACIEFRTRSFISDVYVRPLPEEKRAEIWFEVFQCDPEPREMDFNLSVFGRNFETTVVEKQVYHPSVIHECGVGDALQIALAKAAGTYQKPTPLKVGPGPNRFQVSIPMEDFRWWSPDEPWLYQAQIEMNDSEGSLLDAAEHHFGMRSFSMDEEGETKGALSLNGKPIRLRGANTMGHEQQCVFHKDWDQLRDDILLAKICNMNFLRLTQRPVQPEIYDYCDMLGLMTQSDLPTFAVIRRNQYCEALRQMGEVERLVRPHPCNIMVSYINEPVNNSSNEPHRHLSRAEMEEFFESADKIVRRLNPERVIKACDGDYDPPSPGIQDRHCYCTWYNGQGVDYGRLHKGYWQPTKPGWFYGCGEFGAEGLESIPLMRDNYPASWLPQAGENEAEWSPNRIKSAQTGRFHYFFFETPDTLEEWVSASQRYQAQAMRMMAEAFRRDNRMVTFAVHLFIDAFPSGWMKTIMDFDRQPKEAYFAYRNALAPLLPNLRTDRTRVTSGESIDIEAWVCNDLSDVEQGLELRYRAECGGREIASGKSAAEIHPCESTFQGQLSIPAPETTERKVVTVSLALLNSAGTTINNTSIEVEVFPAHSVSTENTVRIIGNDKGNASRLAKELNRKPVDDSQVILTDGFSAFEESKEVLLSAVNGGARLVILDLAPGNYEIGDHQVAVKPSGFNALHFASRRTEHPLVDGFESHDFRHWYGEDEGYITPIINNTFTCESAKPILLTGNSNENGEWTSALAAAELQHGKGSIVICNVSLAGRSASNPPALVFSDRLLQQ